MAKYCWLTDIHLNHLSDKAFAKFLWECHSPDYTGYFITGDISEAPQLEYHLKEMEIYWQKPIYFVLGNHDFWQASIRGVNRRMEKIVGNSEYLYHLTDKSGVALNFDKGVYLVGHHGWYDGLNGDALNSRFIMNDWFAIREYSEITRGRSDLANIYRRQVIELSQKFASESVTYLKSSLKWATEQHAERVIILTHVPPWEKAHIYNGEVGDAEAQPWFTSRMMGEMLEQVAKKHPNTQFDVLCGHTHGKFDGMILDNLRCRVGGSDYGSPRVQEVIEV